MNKTYSAKPSEVERKWYLIDASDNTLGRISTTASKLLIGKGKAMFTSHIDCGDYVIIINADKLKVTGNKLTSKKYYHHSQHPGGLRTRTLSEQMDRNSTKVIIHAVRGMLPVNKLQAERLKRLKVYAGGEHQHQAQQPQLLSLKKGQI